MNLHSLLRREAGPAVPILASARMHGSPKSWPSEKLERLLTPMEIDQILQHRI